MVFLSLIVSHVPFSSTFNISLWSFQQFIFHHISYIILHFRSSSSSSIIPSLLGAGAVAVCSVTDLYHFVSVLIHSGPNASHWVTAQMTPSPSSQMGSCHRTGPKLTNSPDVSVTSGEYNLTSNIFSA